ncbi:MAG: Holliday junction resolvase RecU [Clostridiales Family XIII bacterium]|nr:Holliday junction resolvase RecU [Clostridiales Family XIII bacterium]
MGAYANRGMAFESMIETANRRYRNAGAAVIEKQHTHFVPIRNGSGPFVACKVEDKGTVYPALQTCLAA